MEFVKFYHKECIYVKNLFNKGVSTIWINEKSLDLLGSKIVSLGSW